MAPSYSGVLAGALLITQTIARRTSATQGSEHGAGTVRQLYLAASTSCLPAPVQLDRYATCVAGLGDDNDEFRSAWTLDPYCAENTSYCVFTNANFPGANRGVSIIDVRPSTSGNSNSNASSALASIAHLLSSVSSFPAAGATGRNRKEGTEKTVPPYELRDIPGKGKGLVATRKIRRGQVFMVDHAAVLADARFPGRVVRDQGRRLLHEAIERLPAAGEILNLARSSADPENVPAVEDVMRTNSFNVEIAGGDYMALFPRIARMNHACKPSAITRFNATTLSNTVTAFHDIMPNEEITISYTRFGLPSPARRHSLLQQWGFTCSCALCSSPTAELAASDARRRIISQLGDQVVELLQQGGPEKIKRAAALYREVVNAVKEEEGLVPHLGNHYEVLGRLYVASGQTKLGLEWLARGRREEEEFEQGVHDVGGGLDDV